MTTSMTDIVYLVLIAYYACIEADVPTHPTYQVDIYFDLVCGIFAVVNDMKIGQ